MPNPNERNESKDSGRLDSNPQPTEDLACPRHEQHMLANANSYRKTLEDINLSGRTVIELGIGTGILTELLLEKNPKRIVGYELDPAVVPKAIARQIDLRLGDFTKHEFSIFEDPTVCLISNPPYSTLPFIRSHILEPYDLRDSQLMISRSDLPDFQDFRMMATLSGEDFSPTSSGLHYIMRKGFLELNAAKISTNLNA